MAFAQEKSGSRVEAAKKRMSEEPLPHEQPEASGIDASTASAAAPVPAVAASDPKARLTESLQSLRLT